MSHDEHEKRIKKQMMAGLNKKPADEKKDSNSDSKNSDVKGLEEGAAKFKELMQDIFELKEKLFAKLDEVLTEALKFEKKVEKEVTLTNPSQTDSQRSVPRSNANADEGIELSSLNEHSQTSESSTSNPGGDEPDLGSGPSGPTT